ncbi:MAG: phosphate ABC transporter substrate-binding protein PstS [Actinomycetota bacterium]
MTRWQRAAALVAVLVVAGTACGGANKPVTPKATESTAEGAATALTGAGATFPAPLYQKWAEEYLKKTGVKVNYQSIGSGGGIQQITAQTVDFGASDAPMKDEELAKAPGAIFHIPTVFGAVVVSYNIPSLRTPIKLTGQNVADIFLGKVTRWNDASIAGNNSGANLPSDDITVVHRSDGSGTTDIFTGYLTSASPEWASKVGKGKEVAWPTGLGGKGNEGVTALVKQTPGSVGYIELAYAKQNSLPAASIKNKEGSFVAPDLRSITAAAAAAQPPDDLRFSLVNQPGAGSYPIAGATWLLVYKEQADQAKGKALVDFLWWAVHDAQKFASALLYAPVPKGLVEKTEAKIQEITYQGRAIRKKV